jgi:WD40 repeat protein
MPWPVSQDYNEAIQDPAACFADPELQGGQAVTDALGLPRPCSGNFADVYQVHCHATGNTWAVKCFTREILGLRERYWAVSEHLHRAQLPFAVDFRYLDQGIRLGSRWYPVVKMRWVEGLTLNAFVRDSADKPAVLDALLQIWVRMARRLPEVGVAHGDLQHGNVLLVPGSKSQSLAVKLIDYDGMYVPALAGKQSSERGHPNYQHPQRISEGTYSAEMDRFGLLVVAAALRCLQVGGGELWQRYDNGDNLLFKAADFASPHKSILFAELRRFQDPAVRSVAARLMAAAQRPIELTPLLEEVFPEKPAASIAPPPLPVTTPPLAPVSVIEYPKETFGFDEASKAVGWSQYQAGGRKRSSSRLFMGVGAGLATLVIGGLVLWARVAKPTFKAESLEQPVVSASSPHADQANQAPVPHAKADGKKRTEVQEGTPPQNTSPSAGAPQTAEPPQGLPTAPGEVWKLQAHAASVRRVAVSLDGRRALTAGHDGLIRLWDLASQRQLLELRGHTDPAVHAVAFLPGNRAASGGKDGVVRIWDLGDGRQLGIWAGQTGEIVDLRVSLDGRFALSCVPQGNAILWNVAAGTVRHRLDVGPKGASSGALSADGRLAATMGADGLLRLWDTVTGKEKRKLEKGAEGEGVAFSPDGRLLLAAQGNVLGLWDVESGTLRLRLEGHKGSILAVAFTVDGRHAVSAADDRMIRHWDLASGKQVVSYSGHTGYVGDVACLPDGRYLLSSSEDRTLRLWRLPEEPIVFGTPVQIAPSPAPQTVATEQPDRSPVPSEAELAEAQKQVRDVYRVELAERSREAKLELAGKLLKRGKRPADTPALRFVYLREARDLAASVPDIPLSMQAVEELTKHFDIEPSVLKADGLSIAVRATRDEATYQVIAEMALHAAAQAAEVDEYPVALRLLELARRTSLPTGNLNLQAMAQRRKAQVESLAKQYGKIRDQLAVLKVRPEDPEANLAVGRFRCLDKDDWARGLPLLATGANATLAELARQELAQQAEADKLVKVADTWWSLAEKEGSTNKGALIRHARVLYRQALSGLQGSEHRRVEGRLELVFGRLHVKPGLVCELFADAELKKKVRTRIDYRVNYNWGSGPPEEGVPADGFSVRWMGYLLAPSRGSYTLVINADDGARLWFDDHLLIDGWDRIGRQTAQVTLDEKPHLLVLEYHEGVGLASMYLGWSQEGGFTEQAVPMDALFHDAAQDKLLPH